VTDGADVQVRLVPLEFRLCHVLPSTARRLSESRRAA
jgi:hypothetical protein